MEVSAFVARFAGVARGRSTVMRSVMVSLRLSVTRVSRLAVATWACASAVSDAHIARLRAQMVRVPMVDSAEEVTVEHSHIAWGANRWTYRQSFELPDSLGAVQCT